jgi:hypothetical protein
VRFLPPGRPERAFQLSGEADLVPLDPRWHQAAARFAALGLRHILSGPDHLLFLFCLVVPLRRLRTLALVVTAFTAAHSVTLIAAARGLGPQAPWFPALVETLIAASIVFMALENVLVARPRRRWRMAFAFGLVHGFGFAFALGSTLQFAGTHLWTALLSFNLGVEAGQLLVLAALVPALNLLLRRVPERAGAITLSALAAHTGWHWMTERWDTLRRFPLPSPVVDAALLAATLRWTMVVMVAAALAWLLRRAVLAGATRYAGSKAPSR